MTSREFVERVLAGEFHFPIEARIFDLNEADIGCGLNVDRKVDVIDRDGKSVGGFKTMNEATHFIVETIGILRLIYNARARAN